MTSISTAIRRSITLVVTLGLAVAGSVTLTASPASAASAPPWHWSQVTGTASLTWYSSKTVALQCPSGYVPISGGFTSTEGGLRLKGQHADLSTNQYVFTFGNATALTQTADINAWCALGTEVGSITTTTKISNGVSAGGRIGVTEACPDNNAWDNYAPYVALGADAEWQSTGSRTLDFLSPDYGSGTQWTAIGTSATSGDSLTITLRCVPSTLQTENALSGYATVTAGSHNLTATCSAGTRVLNGGSEPQPVSDGWADHGYAWASSATRTTWTTSIKSVGADTIRAFAKCIKTNVPAVSWTSKPPAESNAASGQFGYAVSEPFGQSVTVTCTLDYTYTFSCANGANYGPLSEGSHTFSVDAVNQDGEHTVLTHYWNIDLTAPTVTSTSPGAGAAVGSTFDATFSEVVTGVSSSTFQVHDAAGQPVAGTVSTGYASTSNCSGACTSTARFTASTPLSGHSSYTAVLTSGIRDASGNQINTTSWDVTTVNAKPACQNGAASTAINTDHPVSLSCTDGNGDVLTYEVVDGPTHGQLTAIDSAGSTTFTPHSGFAGTDSFTFRASDDFGGTSPIATATIDVGPNHTPTCQDVAQPVPYESSQLVTTDCADVDTGQSLTAVVDSAPAHGGLNTLSSDGTFTYTPYAGYTGQDSFAYHATDGYGGTSATRTVTLYVATDAPPSCSGATINVKHATAVTVPLSCTDPDSGQTLTLSIGTPPAHGALVDMTSSQVSYKPSASFGGTDSFTYTASDGHGGTAAPAKVTLKVAAGATSMSLVARTLSLLLGDKDRLTARLRDAGTGRFVNGQKVLLQTRTSKTRSWSTVTSATTQVVGTRAGSALFTVKPTRSRYYRVVYRGSAAYLASRSAALHVTVKR